jgi:GntR family transcriptional regulator/MocR family aminotransferase
MAKNAALQEFPLPGRPAGARVHRWLYEALRAAIVAGRLKPGARLPSSRTLAQQEGVARSTVVAVFEQLRAEGYVASTRGSGTVASAELPDRFVTSRGSSAKAPTAQQRSPGLSRRGKLLAKLGLPPAMSTTEARGFRIYDPAVAGFPIEEWARALSRRLRLSRAKILGRGDPRGYAPLREVLAEYLAARRGVRCAPEQIVIVSGTQQALDFVSRLTLDDGDAAWIEDPCYPGAECVMRAAGAKIIGVPVDEQGINLDRGPKRSAVPRLVYVTPAHQFPLGATLSAARRSALLALAGRSGAWIFEDDYDGEYRYNVRPIGALQGQDQTGAVIYAGTFNKMLFPTLRLGYLVLPPKLVEPFLALRSIVDRYASVPEQAALADFMREGAFERHIRRTRALCLERRDALLECLARQAGRWLRAETPQAGLHLVAKLEGGLVDTDVCAHTQRAQLDIAALSRFYLQTPPQNALLLGFAGVDTRDTRTLVKRLCAALQEAERGRARSSRGGGGSPGVPPA